MHDPETILITTAWPIVTADGVKHRQGETFAAPYVEGKNIVRDGHARFAEESPEPIQVAIPVIEKSPVKEK